MKATRVEAFGGPEVLTLQEIETPKPAAKQILVQLHAAGVNPVETYIRSGEYARLPALPYTPGSDGAGRVAALGDGAEGFTLGERVYVAGSITGTYAEFCLCEPGQVYPLPLPLTFFDGAALGVPYATAHRALFLRGGATAGETVLIHGGTGGVGIAALQFAKAAGLKVYATGGTETGRVLLTEQGADAVFDHHELGYLTQILDHTEGRGVDLILELQANTNLGHDLEILAPRGRVAVIGSRGPALINPRDAMAREAKVQGVMLGAATREELERTHEAIALGLKDGTLRPVVGRQFSLAQAAQAHERLLAPGAHGKTVLVI